ncbi:hypothetical protein IT403_03265 [Candidatus Nomurabacteria bacterium]|nr:hypothetical protein [Candidatus Nomurabacteria bacterium]
MRTIIEYLKYSYQKILNTPQITFTLSRKYWSTVVINESNEQLVKIQETEKIKILPIKDLYEASVLVRKNIYDRLLIASSFLPEGYCFGIIEGYRSTEQQQKSWDRTIEKIKNEFPEWTEEKIIHEASLVSARPNILANHNCGGALDPTLLNTNGNQYDMGTLYPNENTNMNERKKFPMYVKNISQEQKKKQSDSS